MSKRKPEGAPAGPEVEAAGPAVEVKAEPPAEPERYRVSSWNGIRRLECVLCAFDTLDGEEAMDAHYLERHGPPPPPPRPPTPPIYDRFGNRLS
ncbi:MAG: hypothetical protein ACM3US_09795 [Sphingomonadaceae bacterium]